MSDRDLMQQALEALESDPISHAGLVSRKQAIAALRQELETEQKPVAWYCNEGLNRGVSLKQESPKWAPLYTAPKQWVGLTDEEIQDLSYLSQKIDEGNAEWFDRLGFYRAVEQALKEKNHG